MKKKNTDKKIDIFTFTAECLKKLYQVCHENQVFLNVLKIEPSSFCDSQDSEKYEIEQNLWEKAETYEIMECLNPESPFYKGDKISKSEIFDFLIDIGLEELNNKKNRSGKKCSQKRKKKVS